MNQNRRATFFSLLSVFVGSMLATAIYEIVVRGWQNADWYKALFMGFFFIVWACIFPSSFLVEKKPKEKVDYSKHKV